MKRPLLAALAISLTGCGHRVEQFVRPDQVTDFTALYQSNCSGCHGREGLSGAARPLNNPLFLQVIGKQKLKEVIASGVPKTAMPAFAQNAGGGLTDQQISILADQVTQRWSRPQDFASLTLPPYSTDLGDPKSGETIFRTDCSSCHGQEGTGSSKAGSIVDPSFLALVSNQSLRSSVIAGRGDHNWRSYTPSPLTSQEISDIVTWITQHREPVNLTRRGTKLP